MDFTSEVGNVRRRRYTPTRTIPAAEGLVIDDEMKQRAASALADYYGHGISTPCLPIVTIVLEAAIHNRRVLPTQ